MLIYKYLDYLQEYSIPTKWRKRVEVYILKDDKFIVGYQTYNKMYMPAGGGVEKGQTLEQAAIREALEELGVKIKNPTLITKETYKVDWYQLQSKGILLSDKIKERMKYFKGQIIYFMKADYVGIDKKYYGIDYDSMKPVVITKQKLIQEFSKANWDVNKFRQKIVKML